MSRYVCLLAAVNVAGRSVPSARLRELAGGLGFADPRTVVNSGNLVVGTGTSGAGDAEEISRIIHGVVRTEFGVDSPVITLTGDRLRAAVDANPYPDIARENPAHLLLLAGVEPVNAQGVLSLMESWTGPERISEVDGVAYAAYPDGIGRSKLTTPIINRACGTTVTGRNWNTVRKLLALAAG